MVASKENKEYFYIDLNQDGKFENDEKLKLPKKNKSTKLSFPISIGPYAGIPAKAQYIDSVLRPEPPVPAKGATATEVSKPTMMAAAQIIPAGAAADKSKTVAAIPMVPAGTVIKPGEPRRTRKKVVSMSVRGDRLEKFLATALGDKKTQEKTANSKAG